MPRLIRRFAQHRQRPGFTLPELLVVIAILAVLVALTAGAIFSVGGSQQIKSTRTMLQLSDRLLRQQWSAVVDRARTEPIPATHKGKVDNLSGGDARRGRVIWIKLRLKQAFPQKFSEIQSTGAGADLPGLSDYKNYLARLGNPPGGQAWESAACLLMALQVGPGGAGLANDELNNISREFDVGGGKSIRALVDSWNNPVYFCRWPAQSKLLNPSGAQQGLRDPGDPEGLLTEAGWLASKKALFQQGLHALADRSGSGPMTYLLEPLIVSAGPDQKMGLNPDDFSETSAADAEDNLYSPRGQ